MRVSICVGDYAKTPYCVPGPEVSVFCMEELCFCIRENVFLLDRSLMSDGLLRWIEQECGLRELARALRPFVHKQGSLSGFAASILRYVGFFDEDEVQEAAQALRQGAGLSGLEKRKGQLDYLVKKRQYRQALRGYDGLLAKWQEGDRNPPAADFLARIWHNKGVAYAGLMLYGRAAECFLEAYRLGEEDRADYLAAKSMELSGEEYAALVAEHEEWRAAALELERRREAAMEEWEAHPDYLRLCGRRELRSGDRRRFHEDSERLTHALKESYRAGM